MTKEWQTKPFNPAHYIWIGLGILVIGIDIWLAIDDRFKTLSQYVSTRAEDQPLFAYIIIGIMAYMCIHWFWKRIGKKK